MARARALAANAGWGLFCTSSWTWCIGMFLPLILVRNWGWPGFWVFAIFNVLGCAGFGYWCSKKRSEELCRDHSWAMLLFSGVTIAYQVFFVVFLSAVLAEAERVDPGNAPPVEWLGAAIAVVGGLLLSLAPDRAWPWLGAAAAVVSYTLWFLLLSGGNHLADAPAVGTETHISLLLASPIIAFGFLLCPWLDRTFHRARQLAPSHHAFGVFGATFLPIILMTVAYGTNGTLDIESTGFAFVVAHLGTQLLFTIAAHAREMRIADVPRRDKARQAALLVPAISGLVAWYAGGYTIGFERTYLLLLGFYGLVFPMYVLLFIPLRATTALGMRAWPRTPRSLALFGLLVLCLTPLCAAGFLELKTWLLPIPLAAAALAGWAGRWMASAPATEASAASSKSPF